MDDFEFIDRSIALIDLLQPIPLGEGLNNYHRIDSNKLADKSENLKFNYINLKVKLDLVKCKDNNLYIGYCISTVNKDSIGEIECLFVDKEYRKYGLENELMSRSLEWLNINKVKTRIIGVAIPKMDKNL